MRLLLTTDTVGGIWRYSVDLALGLAARGATPVVATLGPAPTQAQRQELGAVQLVQTGLPLDWTAPDAAALGSASTNLAALASLLGARSVHLHAPALLGRAAWPVPVVAVAHSCVGTWWQAMRGTPPPEDFAWRIAATAHGLRHAAAVVAPSAAHAGALRQVYGPLRATVIHNGATPPAPPPQAPQAGRTRTVLTAGRLWDEAKNAAALDRAAPHVDVPIHAAGPVHGPNGAAVDLPNLHHLGALDAAAMARQYASATVYAAMARYEPFGLSVLEAANAGLRLVLSDIPTFRELWDGAALFTDEANLPATLAAALDDAPDPRPRAARYTAAAMVDATLALHRRAAA